MPTHNQSGVLEGLRLEQTEGKFCRGGVHVPQQGGG